MCNRLLMFQKSPEVSFIWRNWREIKTAVIHKTAHYIDCELKGRRKRIPVACYMYHGKLIIVDSFLIITSIILVLVFVPSAVDGVYGPVLVWRENQWMPVCDKGWSDKQARVVCKQLNYTTGYGFCCSTFSTWLQSIVTYSKALTIGTCPASANKTEDCRSVVLTSCGYRHQASVLCLNQTQDTDGK
jgi:hypothetical protein